MERWNDGLENLKHFVIVKAPDSCLREFAVGCHLNTPKLHHSNHPCWQIHSFGNGFCMYLD